MLRSMKGVITGRIFNKMFKDVYLRTNNMRKGKNAFIDQKHHSIFITETDYRVMRDNVLPPSLADVW